MRVAPSRSASPGYDKIVPVMLALASVALFIAALAQLDRNQGFVGSADGAYRGRVLDYVRDPNTPGTHVLKFELMPGGPGARPVVLTTRDDRPWRTFMHGEEVDILQRITVTSRGYYVPDYIIDDFAAKWGSPIARFLAGALCDIAAVAILVLGRRPPTAATRFPPPLPRSTSA